MGKCLRIKKKVYIWFNLTVNIKCFLSKINTMKLVVLCVAVLICSTLAYGQFDDGSSKLRIVDKIELLGKDDFCFSEDLEGGAIANRLVSRHLSFNRIGLDAYNTLKLVKKIR